MLGTRCTCWPTAPAAAALPPRCVQVAKDLLAFLSSSDLATVREALLPYCRRMGVPAPSTVSEGVRTAVNMVNAKGEPERAARQVQ